MLSQFQESPHNPQTAGKLIGGIACIFTTLYLLGVVADYARPGLWFITTAFITANAYGWTVALWKTYVVPNETVTRRQAATTGALIGLGSHSTVGIAVLLSAALTQVVAGPYRLELWLSTALEQGIVSSVGTLLGATLAMAAFSVLFTLGLPILLSIAATVWLLQPVRPEEPTA